MDPLFSVEDNVFAAFKVLTRYSVCLVKQIGKTEKALRITYAYCSKLKDSCFKCFVNTNYYVHQLCHQLNCLGPLEVPVKICKLCRCTFDNF